MRQRHLAPRLERDAAPKAQRASDVPGKDHPQSVRQPLHARGAEKRGGGEIILVLDELADCLAGGTDAEAAYEVKELEECIRRFVRGLPERDGNVFVRRYFFTEPVASIAGQYGLTENNVAVILSRTRKKLKVKLAKEGYL